MTEPASPEIVTGPRSHGSLPPSVAYVSMATAIGAALFAFNMGRDLPSRTEIAALEMRLQALEQGGPRFSSTQAEQMEQEIKAWVSQRFRDEVPPPVVTEKLDTAQSEIVNLKERQRATEKLVWAWRSPHDCLRVP